MRRKCQADHIEQDKEKAEAEMDAGQPYLGIDPVHVISTVLGHQETRAGVADLLMRPKKRDRGQS